MRNTPYGLVQQQEDEPTDRNTTPTPPPTPPHVPVVDRITARVAFVMGMFSVVGSVLVISFIVSRSP